MIKKKKALDGIIVSLILEAILILFQIFIAHSIGTILFDIVHFSLHQLSKSHIKFLKKIGERHLVHHRFFSYKLDIKRSLWKKNFKAQNLPEYLIQMLGTLFCLTFLPWLPVCIALLLETYEFIDALYHKGMDKYHQPLKTVPPYSIGLRVSAAYHALHHIYPGQFFGSSLRIIDYFLGTGCQLKGKKISLTGSNGALGSNLKKLLEQEGAKVFSLKYGRDYDYDNYEKLKKPLADTDILVLCHGSKYEQAQQANCDSFIAIIELFKVVRPPSLVPAEIWATGSEIELWPPIRDKKLRCYAQSKRNFAKIAQTYFYDDKFQYRHLVHSAFSSKMGPGLMSASFAAKASLFLIKRGFKYVPVSYMGLAYLNYFNFILRFPFREKIFKPSP